MTTRVVVAPDKFKGTLTAPEAAEAIRAGLRTAVPDWEIELVPFADGGDGTIDAVLHAGGVEHVSQVSGPLGTSVAARWAGLDGSAVIEGAEAAGLRYVDPTPDTARRADSAGVGELIVAALDAGYRRVVLGIGGSATTDGGAGALRALGMRVRNADGADLPPGGAALRDAATVELGGLDPRLAQTEIVLCADVLSPFCGPGGASEVFAPQKGADAATVAELDVALRSFARAIRAATGIDLEDDTSGGGAGGTVGGLRAVLGATPVRGVDLLADLLDLDARMTGAGLVVVGEGSLDAQSVLGKAPAGIAARARSRGIPVAAVAGVSTLEEAAAAELGINVVASAAEHAGGVEEAMRHPRRWVIEAAAAVGRWARDSEDVGR